MQIKDECRIGREKRWFIKVFLDKVSLLELNKEIQNTADVSQKYKKINLMLVAYFLRPCEKNGQVLGKMKRRVRKMARY